MSDALDSADGFLRHDGPQDQRYGLSSSVLLTAVLCLVFVIVLITVLHLYVRHMIRRQLAQRRRAQAQLHHRPAAAIAAVSAADHQHQRPKAGLDAAVVAALPKFTYTKKGQDQDHTEAAGAAAECSVCLSQLEEGEMVRQLPACGHTFHDNCIDMWLYSHNTCPLCRKVVGPVANDPPQAAAAVEVIVVVQAGGDSGGGELQSNSRPSVVAQGTPPQMLLPTAAGCGGVSGQGDSSREPDQSTTGAPSRLATFRRMFSLDRAGGRRPPHPADDAPALYRDLERQ